MTMSLLKSVTIALTLSAATLAALPASTIAAPRGETASPIILVASGGWASRTSGHRRTYDYDDSYADERYGWRPGPVPYDAYGVENERTRGNYDYGYGYDEDAY